MLLMRRGGRSLACRGQQGRWALAAGSTTWLVADMPEQTGLAHSLQEAQAQAWAEESSSAKEEAKLLVGTKANLRDALQVLLSLPVEGF